MNQIADTTPVPVAAELYARAGLMPIPVYGLRADKRCMCGRSNCHSPGKHPVGDEWQKRASVDVDAVRDAFRDHRGNIGIFLGNRFVLIDADGEEGLASAASLGEFPPTLEAQSGSGQGRHWIFRLAHGQDPLTITDRSKILPGLDVKLRGQFVAPPSLHASGNRYRWVNAVAPATLPGWLYEKIRRPVSSAPASPASQPTGDLYKRLSEWIAAVPGAVSGNGGHNATWQVANKIAAHKNLTEGEQWALLCAYNERCDPPWSEQELRHKLESARREGRGTPLEERPRPSAPPPSTPTSAGADDDSWRDLCLWTKYRKQDVLKRVPANAQIILEHHPTWRGRLRFDSFAQSIVVTGAPWASGAPARVWTDQDTTRLQTWLARMPDALDLGVTDIDRAVRVVAELDSFHPVRDWMAKLEWDGTPRLAHWLTTYLGVPASDYVSAVGRWWVISAVARSFTPGCKVDHVLVLEGVQGLRKSSALRALVGPDWFSDTPIAIGTKDAFIACNGKLVIELQELASLIRTDPDGAKAFFTTDQDRYRPPYGRSEVCIPRSCVFSGTINRGEYLKDDTGNRRFWPVACAKVDIPGITAAREQLWAEAVAEYHEGKAWYPATPEETALCKLEQDDREVPDAWSTPIGEWLHSNPSQAVTVSGLLRAALTLPMAQWDRGAQMRVASALRKFGYGQRQGKVRGIQTRYYVPPSWSEADDERFREGYMSP